MSKLDEYLTIKEAADYLGVCANTLRNWGTSGKIKEHRNPMNGYRLYAPEDLASLLKRIQKSGEYPIFAWTFALDCCTEDSLASVAPVNWLISMMLCARHCPMS